MIFCEICTIFSGYVDEIKNIRLFSGVFMEMSAL